MINSGVFACALWLQHHMGVNCMSTVCVSILVCLMGKQLHNCYFQPTTSFSNERTNQCFRNNCNRSDEGNWCSPCWGQIPHSHGHGIIIFYKIPTFHCSTWIIINSCAAPLTVCSRNTANKSIREGWGQRKEIGFCQACRQVLNLEYLSHIKSTFIGCNPRPPPLFPLEALSGCVECVSMKEVLGDESGGLFFLLHRVGC